MDIREKTLEEAVSKAGSYINIKPRTAFQVKKYLADKGYAEDIISEVIAQLTEYRYVDDMEYAKMYFSYGFEKGRAAARIKRELAAKGINSDVIDSAYDLLEETPDQNEMAMEIAVSMIRNVDLEAMSFNDKRKLEARIGRRLISRGFSAETAYTVIGRLLR